MKNLLNIYLPAAVVVVMWLTAAGCGEEKTNMDNTSKEPTDGAAATSRSDAGNTTLITTPTGLKYIDLAVGNGTQAKAGNRVSVHYTGWLTNGAKFDSSKDRGQPFNFGLGAGQVIKGWDEGVAGMKIGGKRKLTIPPQLGYGPRGAGNVIPPNATLVFEVELLGVQ
ncbi:MAG: FKBP-type peptidyl-prolyl cis-trans isomerase [Planctomycetes bacterium]|nr:FKBP-type peptidyl-prolyl cis-trans isomerase [Planctomycetota bacterium]